MKPRGFRTTKPLGSLILRRMLFFGSAIRISVGEKISRLQIAVYVNVRISGGSARAITSKAG